MKYPVLSIAGFDGSGGAGIQADLKTFSALGCYGMNVLTAVPVQNTCGVRACYALPTQAILDQLAAIFEDIPPVAIKIGMLFSAEIVTVVAQALAPFSEYIPIVLDPVMYAKSGDVLLQADAIEVLLHELIPLASIITPNLPEACRLLGIHMGDDASYPEPQILAQALLQRGAQAVLLKGGHAQGVEAMDLLMQTSGSSIELKLPRIASRHTHGTGCTLSAAIAARLAHGYDLIHACEDAKAYLHAAIHATQYQSLGKGAGPVHHFHQWW